MDEIGEGSIPRTELASLAPDIPSGLEKIGHFNSYSINTSEDGTSSVVNRIRKIDGNQSGFKVVDTHTLTPEDVEKSEEWISRVFHTVPPNKMTPQQQHLLGIADEIVRVVSSDFRAAQKTNSLSSKPGL